MMTMMRQRLTTFEGENVFRAIKFEHVRLCLRAMLRRPDGSRFVAPRKTKKNAARETQRTSALRIFNLNTWLSFFVGGPNRSSRIDFIADHIVESNYDVVVFQELFTFGMGPLGTQSSEMRALKNALANAGYLYDTEREVLEATPFIGQNSGLFIASKRPINCAQFVEFESRRKLTAKGVLSCNVDGVTIMTTHLDHKAEDMQQDQIDTIVREYARQSIAASSNVLLVGDFNICPTHSPRMYDVLSTKLRGAENLTEDLDWTCDLRIAHDPARTSAFLSDHETASSRPWGATLDHCWLLSRSSENVRVDCTRASMGGAVEGCLATPDGRYASDHFGLEISICRP